MNAEDIEFDPDERLALTQWYIDQNRLDDALTEIKRLLQNDASDTVLLTAARLYAQLRLFERAQGLFSRYLESNPDSINARFQLGMSQFDHGDSEQALDTWHHILAEHPQNPPALFYSALARLQRGEPGEAESMLHSLLRHTQQDNLYHGKASDLLDQIRLDSAGARTAEAPTTNLDADTGKNPYETEH